MSPKKIAKADERSDSFNILWRFCVLDGLKLVLARFDALWSEWEAPPILSFATNVPFNKP
jgi:hypothetical protein